MMDSIGQSEFCQTPDRGSFGKTRDDLPRGHLGNGFITADAGNNTESARSVVIGTGGIVYIAGRTLGSNNDFLIVRHFADGSIDTSFDTDGIMIQSFGTTDDIAHSIILQSNGKLLVAGRSDHGVNGAFNFAILRILSNGTLDTTFGTTGKKLIQATLGANIARAMALQTDGKIIVSGYGRGANWDFAFVRLETNGSLDTSFSTTGKTSIANGSTDNGCLALVITSDGTIVGAGNSYNGSNWDFASVRLTNTGTLDTSFNTTGKKTFAINSADESAYAVVTDLSNRITLVGKTDNGANLDFALARLNTDGSFDTSFSTTGKKTAAVLSGDDAAFGAFINTAGTNIFAVGYAYNGTNNDFAMVRIASDGALDTGFLTAGKYTLAVGSNEDTAQAIGNRGDGLIVIAGRTDTNGSAAFDIAFARLETGGILARSGQIAKVFGTASTLTVGINGTDMAARTLQDTNGKLIIAGQSNSSQFAVARVNMNATLDTSFNTAGFNEKDLGGTEFLTALVLQTDGSIIAGGYGGTTVYTTVLKLLSSGAFDTSFKTSGVLVSTIGTIANAIVLNSDGKIFVLQQNRAALDYTFERYESDGSLDSTFYTIGSRTLSNVATDRAINAGLGAGYYYISGGSNALDSQLIRIFSDGSLDTSFYSDGSFSGGLSTSGQDTWSTSNGSAQGAMVVTEDESKRIILSYMEVASRIGPVKDYVSRFTTSGSLDTSFSTDGKKVITGPSTATAATGAIVLPNSKISTSYCEGATIRIARFLTDGSLDTTYGTAGYYFNNGLSGSRNIFTLDSGVVCTNVTTNDFTVVCVWP